MTRRADTAPPPPPPPPPPADEQPPPPDEQPTQPAPATADSPCVDQTADIPAEFDNAHFVEPTSTTILCSARKDEDLLAVNVPGSGGASIITYEAHQLDNEKLGPKLAFFDANRKRVHRDHGGQGERIHGWLVARAGTVVYLRVKQTYVDEGKLAVTLDTKPIEDTYEPNDTRETAKPLGDGVEAFMYTAANNDNAGTDWYTFETTKRGSVNLVVDASQDVGIKAVVYDANRKRVSRKQGGRSERFEWSFKNKAAGKFYIELKSVYRQVPGGKGDVPSFLTKPYKLTATITE